MSYRETDRNAIDDREKDMQDRNLSKKEPTGRPNRPSYAAIQRMISKDPNHEIFGTRTISKLRIHLFNSTFCVVPILGTILGIVLFEPTHFLFLLTPALVFIIWFIVFTELDGPIFYDTYFGVMINSEGIAQLSSTNKRGYSTTLLWSSIERIDLTFEKGVLISAKFTEGRRDIYTRKERFTRNLTYEQLTKFFPDFETWKSTSRISTREQVEIISYLRPDTKRGKSEDG